MLKYIAALVLSLVCFSGYSADFGFGFGFGNHRHCRPSFGGTVFIYDSGHYETRSELILVKSAYIEKIWVEPVYRESKNDKGEKIKIVVSDGYYREINYPAVYKERRYTAWVY